MFNGKIEKKFIVFEGIDGAGKSSLIHSVHQSLSNKDHTAFKTHEPSAGPIGMFIHDMLSKNDSNRPIHSNSYTYLFAADRHEHLYGENGIYTHLDNNSIVLCDRYLFSSYVYQGVSEETQKLVEQLNQDFPLPSILFFLDITPEESMKRLEHRKHSTQQEIHTTVENITTLQKVHQRYHTVIHQLLQQSNVQHCNLDANKPIKELTEQCMNYLEKHLGI